MKIDEKYRQKTEGRYLEQQVTTSWLNEIYEEIN
jgi:hypothetical protein